MTAVHDFVVAQTTSLAGSAPKSMVVAPGVVLKPVPLILTAISETSGPVVGEIFVTVTAAAAELATANMLSSAATAATSVKFLDRWRTTNPPRSDVVGREPRPPG